MPNLQKRNFWETLRSKVQERAEDGSRTLKGRTEQSGVKKQTCFVFIFFLRKIKWGT